MSAKELPRYEVSMGMVGQYMGWHIHRVSDGHIEKVRYSSQALNWIRDEGIKSLHIIWYDNPPDKYKERAETIEAFKSE